MKSLLEPVREIEDDKTVALCMNWKVVAQEILQSRMTFKFIEIGYVNKSASTNASAQRFGAMKDLPFIVIRDSTSASSNPKARAAAHATYALCYSTFEGGRTQTGL